MTGRGDHSMPGRERLDLRGEKNRKPHMDATHHVEANRVDPKLHHDRYANGEPDLHHADTIASGPKGDRGNIKPTVTAKDAKLWPSDSAGTGDDEHNHASEGHGATPHSHVTCRDRAPLGNTRANVASPRSWQSRARCKAVFASGLASFPRLNRLLAL
jgi:hypothetical protein